MCSTHTVLIFAKVKIQLKLQNISVLRGGATQKSAARPAERSIPT